MHTDIPQEAKDAANAAIVECWQTHLNTPAPDPKCCIPAALAAALPHLGEQREEWGARVITDDGITSVLRCSTEAEAREQVAWSHEMDNEATAVHRTVITTSWQCVS